MSTSTEGLHIPQWDLADRLGKSLRTSGVSVQQMADYLDVHRNTVSAWINGRVRPTTQTIRLWALRTGVPYEWLREGKEPGRPHGGGDDNGGLPLDGQGGPLGPQPPNQPIATVIPIGPGQNDQIRELKPAG